MASRLRRSSRGSAVCLVRSSELSCWASGEAQWASLPLGKWSPGDPAPEWGESCERSRCEIQELRLHPPAGTHPGGKKDGAYRQKQQAHKTMERIPSVSPQVSLQCCLSVSVFVKERIRIHSSVLLTYLLKCTSLFLSLSCSLTTLDS